MIVNIFDSYIAKIFPIFSIVMAYIYAIVTFSRLPILEFVAKKKIEKILKNNFSNVYLFSIKRITDNGRVISYYEFDIILKQDNDYYAFYQIDYKDLTAENLNPNPNYETIKERLNTILKEMNFSLQYEVIQIEQSFNYINNNYIKNAFNVTIVDKNINELLNMKNLYLHQINPKYIKEWLKKELFEQCFRDSFKNKFKIFDAKLIDLKLKIDKIFKDEFPNSPYKLIKLQQDINSSQDNIRLFFQDRKNKIIKEKTISSKKLTKNSFESLFKNSNY